LDPLDPLTEIIRSGQAFSPFIHLERIIWLLIGCFFIGALITGVKNGIKDQIGFVNNKFFIRFKKSNKENSEITNDREENITQN
tara:strand:- start:56 stop:307 length:252 start_codon:yes stop_codon:yes gene_type:complete